MKHKRQLYLFLTTILGILVSALVIAEIEIRGLMNVIQKGEEIIWDSSTGIVSGMLSPYVVFGIVIAGALAGFLIGRVWWVVVYVQKRHPFRRHL